MKIHDRRTSPAAVFLFSTLLSLAGLTVNAGNDKNQEIDSVVKRYAQYHMFNGVVLVAEAGKVIYKAGHGKANLNWDINHSPELKFRVGSVTKQFTAMLIMQLVQEKKLSLQDKVGDHVKGLTAEWGKQVTIHHLLTHGGGVPNTIEIPGWLDGKFANVQATEELLPAISALKLNFAPGTHAAYSNTGYYLLAAVIEAITSKPYAEALKTRILGPLGMTNSMNGDQNRIKKGMVADYSWSKHGGLKIPNPPNMALLKGSGSMITNVGDLYKWDRALYSDQLLDQTHRRIMLTPNHYGVAYGFMVDSMSFEGSELKPKTISHGGQVEGFNALITRFVDEQHLIVLLHNMGATDLESLTRDIAAVLYEAPRPESKLPLNFLLVNALAEGNLAEGIRTYSQNTDAYLVRQADLEGLGNQLLAVPQTALALQVFQLNAKIFANSSQAYVNLARAHREAGDRDSALANLREALVRDKKNQHAQRLLKELTGTDGP